MASALPPILVEIQADVAQLKKGLSDATTAIKGMDENVKKTSSGLSSFIGKMKTVGATLGATFAASQITQFAKDTIMAASDMAESVSKVAVVFGEGAAEVYKFGESAAENLGISNQAALEAAGTYGNLFQAFGMGQGEAQKMSMNLVQLASDMASFNNTSIDDAILALRSGLSGETEPLKRFGVALSDVRLKAEAAALGLGEYKGTLPPLIKSQAAYSLIMKDTTLSQGDYARTASGTANTMKTLAAKFKDAKVALGEALMPAFRALLKILELLIPILKAVGKFFKDYKGEIKAFAVGVTLAATAWGVYKVATNLATIATKAMTIAQKALNVVLKANPVGLIITAVGLLAVGIKKLWDNSETFRKIVISVGQAGLKAFANMIPMVAQFFEAVMKVVTGPLRGLLTVLSKLPGVGKYAQSGLDFINKGLDSISEFGEKAAAKANKLAGELDKLGKAGKKAGEEIEKSTKGKGGDSGDKGATEAAIAAEKEKAKTIEKLSKEVVEIHADMDATILEGKEKAAEELERRDEKIAGAFKDHGKTVSRLNERYQEAMSDANNRYNKQKIALNERYQEQLESAQKRFDETSRNARARHTENLIKISQEYAQKKRDLDYRLQEQLSDLTEKAEEKRLDVMAKGQEKLLSIIEKGRERLRTAWESGTAFSIKDLFGKDVKTQGASGLIEGLREQLALTQTLQTQAGALAGKGYTQTFIEQIIKAGPVAGTEMANALLELDNATQTEIQELYMSLETLNTDGMNSLAESMNNAQSFATAELAEMYQATKDEITKALSDIDAELLKNTASAQKEYERALAEAARTRDEKLAESLEELNATLAAANEELMEAQKQAASELHKGLAEASAALKEAQEEAQKDLTKGLAEAQAELNEKLEEAQKDYEKAIEKINKDTEKKIEELKKKLKEAMDEIIKLNAAKAAALAAATPSFTPFVPAPAVTASGGSSSTTLPFTGDSSSTTLPFTGSSTTVNISGYNLTSPQATATAVVNGIKYGSVVASGSRARGTQFRTAE